MGNQTAKKEVGMSGPSYIANQFPEHKGIRIVSLFENCEDCVFPFSDLPSQYLLVNLSEKKLVK